MLDCRNISHAFGTRDASEPVLHEISLSCRRGEACALIGPSGSGKTTLLCILGCLLTPTAGEVFLDGAPVPYGRQRSLLELRRRQIGFVFQHAQLIPFLGAEENCRIVGRNAGIQESQLGERVDALFERLDMVSARRKKPDELSGGQRQRALGPSNRPRVTGPSRASEIDILPPREAKIKRIAGIGFIEPRNEVRRLVFPVDGIIEHCLVKVGQKVRCGQKLMELRNHRQKVAVDLARRERELANAEKMRLLAGVERSELEAAKKQCDLSCEKLRHAKQERERLAPLHVLSAVSGREYDESQTMLKQADLQCEVDQAKLRHLERFVRPEDVAVADARIAVATEKIEAAQKAFDDTELRAPSDGTVLEILKREGDGTRVLDGQPSIIFGDVSHLCVRAEIDERHVDLLTTDMPATVTGRALGFRRFQGRVVRINQIMGPKTVFARVADERRDLDVVQVLLEMGPDFVCPVGLRVDIELTPNTDNRNASPAAVENAR